MNDATTPRPTLAKAAYELREVFFRYCLILHPYIASIGIGADAIHVSLVREPLPHERPIPTKWMGWPVRTKVVERIEIS